jgi:hypothetical protein
MGRKDLSDADSTGRAHAALEEAFLLSQRLCTLLSASDLEQLGRSFGVRLARAHAFSVVDQLTDLTQRPRLSR